MNRSKRALVAKETVQITNRGTYECGGKAVAISTALAHSKKGTMHYCPDDFKEMAEKCKHILRERKSYVTSYEVANETTLAGAQKLLQDSGSSPFCLNFASAKNPGGGFLSGSQAQEESLARASGLHHCIHDVRGYYDVNRSCGTCLYTDNMIYSPAVPVFRNDHDVLLEEPYLISIITAPAVNYGALLKSNPAEGELVPKVMAERIEKVLAIAVMHGYRSLVLGAWGCGVFRNDPKLIARWFADALSGKFSGAFQRVMFSVLDRTETLECYTAFEQQFSDTPN